MRNKITMLIMGDKPREKWYRQTEKLDYVKLKHVVH